MEAAVACWPTSLGAASPHIHWGSSGGEFIGAMRAVALLRPALFIHLASAFLGSCEVGWPKRLGIPELPSRPARFPEG